MPQPHLRAADDDREAVAAALGRAMADGRLSVAEYEERVGRTWAARTYGELAELTADLPASPGADAGRVRAAPLRGTSVCGPARTLPCPVAAGPWTGHGRDTGHPWRSWAATSVTVLVVYLVIALASWELHHFWPAWVIGPWGAALLAQRFTAGDRRSAHPGH